MPPSALRILAFLLAAATPALAYYFGGVTLWVVLGAGLTLASALSAWVLWQDDLLRGVMSPRRGDAAVGALASLGLYFTVVFLWAKLVAPGDGQGDLLRQCTVTGPRVLRVGLHGLAALFEWTRVHTCLGYARSGGVRGPARGLLIVFIAALEEIAWRGGVQQGLSERLGSTRGWIVASVLYALAQCSTGNVATALLALPCGLVWGALYRYRGRLAPGVFSHAVFSYFLFAVRPLVDFT